MGILVSIIIGFSASLFFAWILYWLDRYEKEPVLLLGGVFAWGAIVAAGSAFVINTVLGIGVAIFTGSQTATELATGTLIAPLVEEVLKGLAVLGVFLIFKNEFDSVLDGIIYAGVTALGFAATENSYYIYSYGYQEGGWSGLASISVIRIFLVGWQHPFYTAFTGIGLAFARLNRNWFIRVIAPLLGLSMAMFTHAVHNTLASLLTGTEGLLFGTAIDWTGWLFMFGIIIWATLNERKNIKKYLGAELRAGNLSPDLYRTASSAWRQMFSRTAALFTGRYRKTARFFQLCGEYAHRRNVYDRLGDEGGSMETIQNIRAEMLSLAPFAQI